MLVAVTPVPDRDAARPSLKPTAPNLAVQYGNRCGTETSPPTDAIVPIRPRPRSRIPGSTASAVCTGPMVMVVTASRNCSTVTPSTEPTWMIPATVISTSTGPRSRSTSRTRASTWSASATSHT